MQIKITSHKNTYTIH